MRYDYLMMGQQTIGIVGGGQLGRMLTLAALPLGFKVIVLDPTPNSPASQAGAEQITRPYDKAALAELAKRSNYLTTEFEEGLNLEALSDLVKSGAQINPKPQTIALILDKLKQKSFLSKRGVAMGPFAPIQNAKDALRLLKTYGGKMLIKTRRGGYDGYGNRLVSSSVDVEQAFRDFDGQDLYAEAFVPFKKELAVMVVRGGKRQIVSYPVVETIQKNNICHEVLAPAAVKKVIEQKATNLAKHIAKQFNGAGMFGVELFLTKDGQIWLNEVAPRVHNSGHYSIEANRTSQFEQHIRAVTGLPLGDTSLVAPAAVMINILGERDGPARIKGLHKALDIPHTSVHIYGKSPTKIGRKMGHITATGKNLNEAQRRARLARAQVSI